VERRGAGQGIPGGRHEAFASSHLEAEANLWLTDNPGRWDLAIVDLVLEQGSGMSVIAKCKRRPGASKVVVFSDYVTPGIHKHCMGLGADAAILKSDTPAFIDYCSGLAPAA
jgi:DNA-binding NarL/FixJ family response regulator